MKRSMLISLFLLAPACVAAAFLPADLSGTDGELLPPALHGLRSVQPSKRPASPDRPPVVSGAYHPTSAQSEALNPLDVTPFAEAQVEGSVAACGDTIVIAVDDYTAPPSFAMYAWSHDGGRTFSYGYLPAAGGGDLIEGLPDLKVWTNPATGRSTFVCCCRYSTAAGDESFCVHVSDDGGVSWKGPREIEGVTSLIGFPDIQRIDLDPETGRLIACWDHYYGPEGGVTTRIVWSDDFGLTWSPQTVFTNGGKPCPAFDPTSNSVYVAWVYGTISGRFLAVARSADNGATWSVQWNAVGAVAGALPAYGIDYDHALVQLDVGPVDGRVGLVYSNRGADFGDVFFSSSMNHGMTWSAPLALNANPGADRSQFYPAIAAHSPSPGVQRFDVIWYDQRAGSGNSDLTEVVHRHSLDGGLTWTPPAALTVKPFHLAYQPHDGGYYPLYTSAFGQGGVLYAVYAATGMPDPFTTDPDVYLSINADASPASAFSVASTGLADVGCIPDAIASANEIVDVSLTLRNEHAGANSGVSAVLSTTTPGVGISAAASNWPGFGSLDSQANSTPFRFYLPGSYPCGTPVDFRLDGTGGLGPWRLDFSLPTGVVEAESTLFAENFDAVVSGVPAGWVQTGTGTANPWAVSSAYRRSSPKSIYCADRADQSWSRIETPTISVPTGTDILEVSFYTTYDIEQWTNGRWAYDGALVMINVDGSDRPADSFASDFDGRYSHALFTNRNNGNRLQGESVWSGSTLPNFQTVRIDYPGLAGHAVKLAFEMGSDWINGRTGIFIDDVVVRALKVGCGTCAEVSGVQPPEDLLRSGLGSINPNPFSNRATVAYTVTDAGPVKLQVFDLTGRLIRTLKSGQGDTNSGVHRSSWDGMDENGARVPNGIYFVRLKIGEQSWNRRAILIR